VTFTAWPYPPPPDDPLHSVGITGDRFTINGRLQHVRGFTDFAGFDVFRRTGQISPLALQLQQVHHDFVSLSVPALTPRILLMKNAGSLFDLDPRTLPNFFDVLDRHAAAMTAARFLPLYVLLADCAANGMNLGYQQEFVGRACEVLKNHLCLVELVNEYDNGPQQVNPLAFDKPAGVIISRGSPAEALIPFPVWDWVATRARRDAKWLQTIADSAYAFRAGDWGGPPVPLTCPVFDTEPRGAGETDGKRYTSTTDAFALGCDSALWNHAAVLHTEAGTTSSLLGPNQLNVAICFYRGMLAVPEIP
jgi:hypothetical protein